MGGGCLIRFAEGLDEAWTAFRSPYSRLCVGGSELRGHGSGAARLKDSRECRRVIGEHRAEGASEHARLA